MRTPTYGLVVAGVAMGLGSTCAFLQAPISRLPRIAPSIGVSMPVSPMSSTAVTCGKPIGAARRQEMRSYVSLKAQAREAPAVSSTGRRKSLLVKSVLGAVPLLVAALVVVLRPEGALAAAQVAAEAVPVNKVRALLSQVAAGVGAPIAGAVNGVGSVLRLPVIGAALSNGWNGPLPRFAQPPMPGTLLGDAVLRLTSALPAWSPLQVTAFLSLLPFLEARVGVPLGVAMGAPWLKALLVGCGANLAAIPIAAYLGSQAYYDATSQEWDRTVQQGRGAYVAMFTDYAQLEGRLAVAKALLESEETQLRVGLDEAIAALCSGDLLLSLPAREALVADIVRGSTILLSLEDADVSQLRSKLSAQAFDNTVGNVLNDDEAFQEVTVAALGQRRVEASWHPDMAILPEVAQAHTAQHLAEVAAQSRVDFVERALAVQAMRSDVAKLEDQASRGREAYRKKAASVVEDTRTVLGRVKQFFDKESEVRRKLSDREKAALERVEEDERVAMLQKKGRVIMAYGWPGALLNVGVPLPWDGAWSAMYMARSVGMSMQPSAVAVGLGSVASAIVGLTLAVAGKWAAGAYVLALLYRVNEGSFFPRSVRAWWAELLEERSERQAKLAASDEKARKKGGEDPNARRPA